MSLRTKLMLITFLFMVIVIALLTLNLAIDAASNRARERSRTAQLLERLAADWVRECGGTGGVTDWNLVAQKLSSSALIDNWLIVGLRPDGTHFVVAFGGAATGPVLDDQDTKRLTDAIRERKTSVFERRVYIPVETRFREVFGARLDVNSEAVPPADFQNTLRGIVLTLVLGTALLLITLFLFLNVFVLRPLQRLVEVSDRVAEGDFSRTVQERGSYDEMARLERAFNQMIEKIRSHHQSLKAKITKTERRLFHAQRLSATGTLAAGIAHEINNPLGGMLNAARAIQSGQLDEAKRAEYVGLIVEGLERVRAIVGRVLQFRPREFEPRPLRLREVADRAIAFCEHRFRHKEVEVVNEVPPELPLVNGDALELQQAFLNVLMNAVDACVIGEGRVVFRGRVDEDTVRVSVADNGVGMDAEELSHCLDVFFTTKDPGDGTGLGLSVVNSIIENHGGKLEIESKKGEGTTVHLLLPALKAVPSS